MENLIIIIIILLLVFLLQLPVAASAANIINLKIFGQHTIEEQSLFSDYYYIIVLRIF